MLAQLLLQKILWKRTFFTMEELSEAEKSKKSLTDKKCWLFDILD